MTLPTQASDVVHHYLSSDTPVNLQTMAQTYDQIMAQQRAGYEAFLHRDFQLGLLVIGFRRSGLSWREIDHAVNVASRSAARLAVFATEVLDDASVIDRKVEQRYPSGDHQ